MRLNTLQQAALSGVMEVLNSQQLGGMTDGEWDTLIELRQRFDCPRGVFTPSGPQEEVLAKVILAYEDIRDSHRRAIESLVEEVFPCETDQPYQLKLQTA